MCRFEKTLVILALCGLAVVPQAQGANVEVENDAVTITGTGAEAVMDELGFSSYLGSSEGGHLGWDLIGLFEGSVYTTYFNKIGFTFPDSSQQKSAAYSKSEVDALLDVYAKRSVRPRYFLTPEKYYADQALTACETGEPGYHMASIFELADPSYLVYDYTRGLQTDDSGWGPPLSSMSPLFTRYGWVRTGFVADDMANCSVWTASSEEARGSAAGAMWDMSELTPGWDLAVGINGPDCSYQLRVWCIEDPELD